jgi:hypothetical protein
MDVQVLALQPPPEASLKSWKLALLSAVVIGSGGLHVLYEETPDFSPPLVATLPGDARVLVSVSDAYRMYATNTWGPIWKFTHRGRVLMPLAWGTTGTGGIAVQGK